MKKFKAGDMVQVWDWQSSKQVTEKLTLHGKLGYLVKLRHELVSDDKQLWEVIFFDSAEPERQIINSDWLVKITKPEDIKKRRSPLK